MLGYVFGWFLAMLNECPLMVMMPSLDGRIILPDGVTAQSPKIKCLFSVLYPMVVGRCVFMEVVSLFILLDGRVQGE